MQEQMQVITFFRLVQMQCIRWVLFLISKEKRIHCFKQKSCQCVKKSTFQTGQNHRISKSALSVMVEGNQSANITIPFSFFFSIKILLAQNSNRKTYKFSFYSCIFVEKMSFFNIFNLFFP